jgi:hypothetical protein
MCQARNEPDSHGIANGEEDRRQYGSNLPRDYRADRASYDKQVRRRDDRSEHFVRACWVGSVVSMFKRDISPSYVSSCGEAGFDRIGNPPSRFLAARKHTADSPPFSRLLRLADDWRGEEAASRSQEERPSVHHSIT